MPLTMGKKHALSYIHAGPARVLGLARSAAGSCVSLLSQLSPRRTAGIFLAEFELWCEQHGALRPPVRTWARDAQDRSS